MCRASLWLPSVQMESQKRPPEGGSSETSSQEETPSQTPSQDDQSGTGSAGQDLQAAGSNALLWVMIMFFALALAAGGSVVLEQRKRRE